MKFIIFFIYIHLVYSELHTFMTIYTEKSGKTAAGIPEFSAVTTLDDQQIDYNDSDTKKLIPRKKWMKDYESKYKEPWKKYTEIREKLQQVYKNNIHDLMQKFSQSHDLLSYQMMYGCDWDNETGDSKGFDRHNYDGKNIITLDLEELRYFTAVPQAESIVMKWNNDKKRLESLKHYLGDSFCVYWLKEFLYFPKATLEKADPPKVSLLPKNSDYYVECHVTGFLYRNTTISWKKNGQAIRDKTVETGDTLPNEDGTFWRNLTLYVLPDDRKKDQYTCVVEHKSLTETIQKILTEDEIKRSKAESEASSISSLVLVIIAVIVGLCVLCVLCTLFALWIRKQIYPARYKEVNKPTENPQS